MKHSTKAIATAIMAILILSIQVERRSQIVIDMPLTEEQKSARSVYRLESAENGIRKGEIGDSYQRGVL